MQAMVAANAVRVAYQVMTLSAIGEADTPAGGSVCIRCSILVSITIHISFLLDDCFLAASPKEAERTLKSRIRRRRAAVDMVDVRSCTEEQGWRVMDESCKGGYKYRSYGFCSGAGGIAAVGTKVNVRSIATCTPSRVMV